MKQDSSPRRRVPAFTPVRLRFRRDGWTPEVQIAFIASLTRSRCVLEACRRVGRSSESAYRLYRRAEAESFRRAWDAALALPARPSTSAGEWHVSGLSVSSTSTASDPPRRLPAYSLEAFLRAARRRPAR